MSEYQEIIALMMINKRLKSKVNFGVIGEIKINPNPTIWIAVLYFPVKSDLTSFMDPDLETMNSLK